jgi:hypothetical protein
MVAEMQKLQAEILLSEAVWLSAHRFILSFQLLGQVECRADVWSMTIDIR